MPDYWSVEGNGIWLTETGGGWLIEVQPVDPESGPCLLIDLDEFKTLYGITGTDDDAYITAQIEYFSAIISNYCERIFCVNDYTQTWQRPMDTGLVWGSKVLALFHYPVNSIASVTVNGTLLDAADWTLNTRDWTVISEAFLTGYDIEITYNAGFDPIPADVAMSCNELVFSKYMNKGNDPSRIVRSESVPEVGSVDYLSAQYYQRGFDPVIGNYGTTLDRYRTERAIVPDISA